jgi:hypothetical protein
LGLGTNIDRLKFNFLLYLYYFNVLILKKIKKYYFNIFLNKKIF